MLNIKYRCNFFPKPSLWSLWTLSMDSLGIWEPQVRKPWGTMKQQHVHLFISITSSMELNSTPCDPAALAPEDSTPSTCLEGWVGDGSGHTRCIWRLWCPPCHLFLCLVGGLEIISSCTVITELGEIEADSLPFYVTACSFYLDLRSQIFWWKMQILREMHALGGCTFLFRHKIFSFRD